MATLPNAETLRAELTRLEAEERELDKRRALVRGQIITTHRAITRAEAEARERAQEPADLAALERITSRLKARLAAPSEYPFDKDGWTRKRVKKQLEALERNTIMPVRDRLALAKRLEADFADRYRLDGDHWAAKGTA